MTTSILNELIQKADALTPDEQLRLIAHLAEKVRVVQPASTPRYRWRDVRGLARYPMLGEDAQAWVTRTRREGTEQREKQWQREA